MGALLLLIPIGVVVVINFLVAQKFEEIAFQKGYDTSIHSLALCFWLGIAGWLYVIALPDLRSHNNIPVDKINEEPQKKETSTEIFTEENPKKKKYDQLISKAEKYKDSFFERNYRIRIYESIVKDLEAFACENFEDSEAKLKEYRTYLDLLKNKKIK